ncbi:MAG: primosomal protein N' (replication factor Y) - superfamily II helicase [Pseudomonadota bacterium]
MNQPSTQPEHESGHGSGPTLAKGRNQFPCEQCGAVLRYAIGTRELSCEYCGHSNAIAEAETEIREHDLADALRELDSEPLRERQASHIRCQSCGARFELSSGVHAGECVFCSEPVVLDTATDLAFQPESLLPLSIDEKSAKSACEAWLSGLWFAPSALQRVAETDQRFSAVFLPYWTYDSDTTTRYQGQRGESYTERRAVWVTRKGKRVREVRQVTKVKWYPASGRVSRHFDDVLIGASRTLPRQITDRLAPWDLDALVPYQPQWLSGSQSEVYQVALDEGFEIAQQVMKTVITGDVKRHIGGDFQRITGMQTRHQGATFKHILLPVWMASFRFAGTRYRFLVNARSGKVAGERPWSAVKIALAITAAVALAAGVAWVAYTQGYFQYA